MARTFDAKHRIALVGDSGVGKTKLVCDLIRLGEGCAVGSTTGANVYDKKLHLINGRIIALEVWDVAGLEAVFVQHNRSIVLFDLSNKSSFNSAINYWIGKINNLCSLEDSIVCLVGTKKDLLEEREVSQERAQSIADELGLRYFEATDSNVDLIFMTIAQELDELDGHENLYLDLALNLIPP